MSKKLKQKNKKEKHIKEKQQKRKIGFSFLKHAVDIYIFIATILVIEATSRLVMGMKVFNQAFIYSASYLCMFTIILVLFKEKVRKIIEIVIATILTIYNFVQIYYYAFFGYMFSFKSLAITGEFKTVLPEVLTKWRFSFLLIFIPLILFVIILIKKHFLEIDRDVRNCISKFMFILFFVLFGTTYVYRIATQGRNMMAYYESDMCYFYERPSAVRSYESFGSMKYLYSDIKNTVLNKESIDKEKQEVIDNTKFENNDKTGIFEGKNLVLILGETFGEGVISEDLTPTLYKLEQEGFNFNNHYAPLFQSHTSDSEFAAQTGLLPSIDFSITGYTFANNTYPMSLANLFNEKGYKCNSFHSFYGDFYNRKVIHKSFGFEYFYDNADLDLWADGHEWANWVKDSDLVKATMERTDMSKPFYDFIISVTGHTPYSDIRVELNEYMEIINSLDKYDEYDEESKYYLASQMELDRAVETLIEILKENNQLENTVIAIFGDHYGYTIDGEEAKQRFVKEGNDKFRVPFIIWNSEISGEQIEIISSTVDINPTLTNMFNLNKNYFKFGNDIFSVEDNYVLLPDLTVINQGDRNYDEIKLKYKTSQAILYEDYYKEK